MKTISVAETAGMGDLALTRAEGLVVSLGRPAVLFGGVLVLYLLTTSYQFGTGDGASEVALAARPAVTFRPYHLLQTSFYKATIGLWSLAGWTGQPLVPVHVLNIILGSATVSLFWLLLVRFGLGEGIATFGGLLFALSNAVWRHSSSADTGMTPMPFLLGAVLLLCPRMGRPLGTLRISVACALFSLAVALSLNIVLFLPALLILVLQRPRVRSWARLLVAFGSLSVFGLGPFLLVSVAEKRVTPTAFVRWIAHHPESDGLRPGLRTALQAPRAWAGIGRLVFPKSHGATVIKGLIKSIPVKTTSGDWITLFRNLLFSLLLVCLAGHGMWVRRREPRARALAGFIILTAGFCLLWLGSDPQFWLPAYPFLLAFAMVGLAPLVMSRRVVRSSIATGICLLLLLVNSRTDLPTLLTPIGSNAWQTATRAAKTLAAGDLVIGPGGGPLDWVSLINSTRHLILLTYPSESLIPGARLLPSLKATIEDRLRKGHRVFIYGLREPVPPEILGFWELLPGKHGVSRKEVETFLTNAFILEPASGLGEAVDRVLSAEYVTKRGASHSIDAEEFGRRRVE